MPARLNNPISSFPILLDNADPHRCDYRVDKTRLNLNWDGAPPIPHFLMRKASCYIFHLSYSTSVIDRGIPFQAPPSFFFWARKKDFVQSKISDSLMILTPSENSSFPNSSA